MAFNLATNWKQMFDNLMSSSKRTADTIGLDDVYDNSIGKVVKAVEDTEKTANKYFTYILWGLGLVAVIVVVDTVGDVLD